MENNSSQNNAQCNTSAGFVVFQNVSVPTVCQCLTINLIFLLMFIILLSLI